MVLTDDCRAIAPASLSTVDNVNGAGTRTFIWNDGIGPIQVTTAYYYWPGYTNLTVTNLTVASGIGYVRYGPQIYRPVPNQENVKVKKLEEVKIQEVNRPRQLRLED